MKPDFRICYLSHRDTVPFALCEELMLDTDITYMHNGSADYRVDGKKITVYAGQVLFVPKGCRRERIEGKEKATYTSIIIKHNCDMPVNLPTVINSADTYDIKFCIDRITELYMSSELYSEEKIDSLVKYLFYSLALISNTNKKSRYVHEMKSYIENNFASKLSLNSVAASAHLSKSYASTVFRKETGMSINDYIISVRVSQASKMLKYTEETAVDIAEKCGFCDAFYFNRAFKREKGITPNKYRSKHRNVGNEESLGYYRQNIELDIELGIKTREEKN